MDGCISWKWVSFISHQKCVIQDVLKMTGEEVSQPSYPGVLSCVRKSVCILWLQTDQVSVAPHKGQRLEASNQTKQHECSTGAERAQNMGHMTSAGYLGQARVMLQTVHILTPVLVRIQHGHGGAAIHYYVVCWLLSDIVLKNILMILSSIMCQYRIHSFTGANFGAA